MLDETSSARHDLLCRIQRRQAEINRQLAAHYRDIAEFTRTAAEPATVPRELALALAITVRAAEQQVHLAEALMNRLPQTFQAMRRGEIDPYKATKISEPTAMLTDEQARQVDAIIATRLAGKDPTGLRRSTNLAVAKVDPDGHARRCAQRRARRRVELVPLEDGMVKLSADLPVELGVAAYTRIDAEARRRRRKDPSTTLDQHRADVFADQLLTDSTGLPVGPKAEVFVYLDFYTWLNLNTKPAELAGQGVIPAWLANHIASGENTVLRRIITDPEDGQIISVGRRSYRPPAALARLAYSRDRECRSPVCHLPPKKCANSTMSRNGTNTTARPPMTTSPRSVPETITSKTPSAGPTPIDTTTGEITIKTPTGHHYPSAPEPLHEPRTDPLAPPDEQAA